MCEGVLHPVEPIVSVGGGGGEATAVAISSTLFPLHLLSFLHERTGHEDENGENL